MDRISPGSELAMPMWTPAHHERCRALGAGVRKPPKNDCGRRYEKPCRVRRISPTPEAGFDRGPTHALHGIAHQHQSVVAEIHFGADKHA